MLFTLDVLLTEGSVVRAARRLGLSPSAMSRALARLREMTGDPLLVRAGRALVATPRAVELRAPVGQLVREAETVLGPAAEPDLAALVRAFTLRASDGFVESFGPALLARVRSRAPGVSLRFVQKPDKSSAPLLEGTVDLETGVVDASTSPDLRTHALFRDRLVGVVRKGHALTKARVTAARYAAGEHVTVSRPSLERGPIDEALATLGLRRESAIVVGGFASALALARGSDLIATVPERHTESLRAGMHSFTLPVPARRLTISMLWHPRVDADPVHRWLRGCVRDVCADGDR